MDPPIVRTEIAYYDEYEFLSGDGFHPTFDQDQGEPYDRQINISFMYSARLRGWVQISGHFIVHLDGDFGDRLLARLNSPNYILHPPDPPIYIYNTGMMRIHPKPNVNNFNI